MLVNVQSQDINVQRKKETEENFTKGEVLNLLEIFRFGKWNNFFRFFALHAIFNKVCWNSVKMLSEWKNLELETRANFSV